MTFCVSEFSSQHDWCDCSSFVGNTVRTIISAPPLQNAVSHTSAERMQLLVCRSPISVVWLTAFCSDGALMIVRTVLVVPFRSLTVRGPFLGTLPARRLSRKKSSRVKCADHFANNHIPRNLHDFPQDPLRRVTLSCLVRNNRVSAPCHPDYTHILVNVEGGIGVDGGVERNVASCDVTWQRTRSHPLCRYRDFSWMVRGFAAAYWQAKPTLSENHAISACCGFRQSSSNWQHEATVFCMSGSDRSCRTAARSGKSFFLPLPDTSKDTLVSCIGRHKTLQTKSGAVAYVAPPQCWVCRVVCTQVFGPSPEYRSLMLMEHDNGFW
jgi:hypothetical protein